MGGDITVRSAPGEGSTFVARVPNGSAPAFAQIPRGRVAQGSSEGADWRERTEMMTVTTHSSARLLGTCTWLALATMNLGAAGVDAVDVRGTVRAGNKPQSTAVVWLEAPTLSPSEPQQTVVLHQRNLTFLPHVLAVQTGTTVDFPNEDRVFHNVFSFKDGKPFDLGIYPVGSSKRVTFSQPGVTRLHCNIHPNMSGYIVSVDSPYYSAVDEGGAFTLATVPPGTYAYHAWVPGRPVLKGSVVVQAGSVLDIRWP
jgi:plastocyanin